VKFRNNCLSRGYKYHPNHSGIRLTGSTYRLNRNSTYLSLTRLHSSPECSQSRALASFCQSRSKIGRQQKCHKTLLSEPDVRDRCLGLTARSCLTASLLPKSEWRISNMWLVLNLRKISTSLRKRIRIQFRHRGCAEMKVCLAKLVSGWTIMKVAYVARTGNISRSLAL
jgi:hypothetical protein